MDDQLKPFVTRREDGEYVVHNVDLEPLTNQQRTGIGMLIWDQVRELMERNGEDASSIRRIAPRVAQAVGAPLSNLERSASAMNHGGAEHLDALIAGEIDLTNFWRKSGLAQPLTIGKKPIVVASDGTLYYGKGDRFNDATEPLLRYLRAWKKKGFEFRHLPPKEARRRLSKVNELFENLSEAKRDLEARSHFATLSLPKEKGEDRK